MRWLKIISITVVVAIYLISGFYIMHSLEIFDERLSNETENFTDSTSVIIKLIHYFINLIPIRYELLKL